MATAQAPDEDDLAALLTRREVSANADAVVTLRPSDREPPTSRAQLVETLALSESGGTVGSDTALLITEDSYGGLVGDLRLEETLARGGTGIVKVADQPSLDRRVAVKSLLADFRNSRQVWALLREARMAGRLDHPNIVPVHAIGLSPEDGPFIVMKRVTGISWSDHLNALDRSDPRWLRRELETLMDVCRAIAFAHDRGVIHRDIKPANVMLGEFGEVYLLDWGAGVDTRDDDVAVRRELVGTPAYMAPEQVDEEMEATFATDVYLLGACLTHILTGRPPHYRSGKRLAAVLALAVMSDPVEFGPDVHPLLAAIAHRACAPEPADRYSSAEALRTALATYLDREGSLATAARAQRETDALLAEMAQAGSARADTLSGAWSPEQLDADADIQRRFGVARFAFTQALEQWSGNEEAARGLQLLLAMMAAYELDRENTTAAAGLIAELEAPSETLTTRLEALRKQTRLRAKALEDVAALREQQRFHGRNWVRSGVAATTGVGNMIIGFVFGHLARTDPEVGPGHAAVLFGVGAILTQLTKVIFREHITDSARYMRFMQTFLALFVCGTMMSAMGATVDMPLANLWVGITFLGMGVAATMALTVEPSMWVAAALAAATTPVAVYEPAYAPEAIGIGFFFSGTHLAWVMRPGQPERLDADGRPMDDWVDPRDTRGRR